jgi:ABC-type phosphate transport system substrate-binding protein
MFNKDMFINKIVKLSFLLGVLLSHNTALALDIITHPTVKVNTLTTSQIRRIYAMRQVSWPNDLPIIVYVLPSKSVLHQKFSKEILHMFPYQLDRIWNKLTYSGVGVAPIKVPNQEALIEAVMSTPGAIGYAELMITDMPVHVINIKG